MELFLWQILAFSGCCVASGLIGFFFGVGVSAMVHSENEKRRRELLNKLDEAKRDSVTKNL